MSELGAGLLKALKAEDERDLEQWISEQAATPAPEPPPKPELPIVRPTPPRKNSVKSAALAAWDSANTGAGSIAEGLWDVVSYTPPHPEDIGRGAVIETASSMVPKAKAVKKIIDGIFGIAMAPGVGAADFITEWGERLAPETMRRIAVPGGPGGLAPLLRGFLGQPALSGTPAERQALQGPMTVGEVVEVAAVLGGTVGTMRKLSGKSVVPSSAEVSAGLEAAGTALGAPGMGRVVPLGKGKPAPTPPPAGDAAAVPATDVATTMQEANKRGRQPGSEVVGETRETIQAQYRRGFDILRQSRMTLEEAINAAEVEAAAALRTAGKDVPPPKVPSVADVVREVGELDLVSDIDALSKFVKERGGLAPSPTGDLAGELKSVPASLKNKSGLPPAAMAEALSEQLGRPIGDAELLDLLSRQGRERAKKVDRVRAEEQFADDIIPTETAVTMDRPPADVAELFMPGEWERMPENLRLTELERMRSGERDWMQMLSNEDGAIDAGILGRVAIGGLLGGASGDTPEESIRNALLGAGLGLLLSRSIASRIGARIKSEVSPEAAVRAAGRQPRGAGAPKKAEPLVTEGATYHANYARIQADPATIGFLKDLHETLKPEIIVQKRGVRSLDTTEAAARELISSGKMSVERIMELEPGSILNAEEQTAARMLNVSMANHFVKLSERLHAGEPVPAGDISRAAVISGEVAKRVRAVSGEIGRASGAHNIIVGEAALNPVRLAERLSELGDVTERQLAEIAIELKHPEVVARFTKILTAIPGAVLEALYGALLSGKALVKNAVGGAIMMPLAASERMLAQAMPTWGKSVGRVLPGEGAQMFAGLYEGVVDHLRMLKHLDREGLAAEVAEFGRGKTEQRGPRITAQAFEAEGTPVGQMLDFTGQVVRGSLEVMNGTDAVSQSINGRMAMRVESFRQASREGLVDGAFTNRVNELVDNPGLLSEEARLRIADFRKDQTFTKDFEGRMLSAIQAGPHFQSEVGTAWAQLFYRWFAATFVRAPLRIAEATGIRTPGLNLAMAQFWRDWNAGGAQRQIAQARLATGMAIIGTFGYLEFEGVVTGTAPENPAHRKAWEQAGYQAVSFWDPISEKYRSYDGLEPLTTLISTGADIARGMRLNPTLDWPALIITGAMAQVRNLDTKSYLQSVSQLIDLIRNPSDASMIENGLGFIRKKLEMFRPAVLGEIESGIDPTIRRGRPGSEPSTILREFQTLLRSYQAKTPFFSESVPPERNFIDGTVIVGESWPYNPFIARTPKTGIVWTELMRLRGAGLNALPEWIGEKPVADVGLDQPAPAAVRLSPEQRDRWTVLQTQVVKDGRGQTLYEHLRALFSSPEYVQQSETRQIELIQRRFAWYRDQAEQRLRKDDPDVRTRLTRQEIEKKIRRVPTAKQDPMRQLLEQLIKSGGH